MTWGFASYETRFRWAAALWAVLMTIWCMSPLPWRVRVFGAILWVAITLGVSVRFAWWRSRSAREVPIFLRMRCANEAAVERLIRNLVAAGYRLQTVSEALEAPARKAVAITFDDGGREAFSRIFPLLKKLHAKATFFVTDRGAREADFLKPLEIQEMARSGLIEFGGTAAPLPPGAEVEAWRAEILRNRRWLTGVLGALPRAFAYPDGTLPEVLGPEVQAVGYPHAFTVNASLRAPAEDPLAIPRRDIPGTYKPWQAYLMATRGRFSLCSRA